MTALCHPLPKSVTEELLQLVARAICDRPDESARQRESRTRQMVHSTLGFEPRDGLEYMLSTMVVGHFHLILDSMRDVLRGQMDSMKARTKTTIVSLDRSMLAFVREMRVERRRRTAQRVDADQAPAATPQSSERPEPDWIPVWAGVNPAPRAEAEANPDAPRTAASRPEPAPGPAAVTAPNPAPQPTRIVATSPEPGSEDVPSDAATREHIADFEAALAALAASLEEARAVDSAAPERMAAAGD